METERPTTQTETQPASSIEQSPTESRRGRWHTEETKAKISEALSGENHPMYGKQHSEEARAKMSKAKLGENHPMYGKELPEETRAKISKAHKGKKLSEEHKAKLSKAQKGKQHSEEAKAKIGEARKDKSIEQVKQAIVLHAAGMPMTQASLRMGFSINWLFSWKARYPERFQAFYFEEIEKNDRKMIRRAVEAYALGASMEEASRHVGMPEGWFRSWQDENFEKFEIWLKHINDKETRLVRQIFRFCSDEDMSMEEAVSELDLESDWLKNWRENHPVRYGQIKEEEKLIFGDRLNNLLIRYERKM